MTTKYFAFDSDGKYLTDPDSEIAAEGEDVLLVALPDEVHVIQLPSGVTHVVTPAGVLVVQREVRRGASPQTVRQYGTWLYTEVVPYAAPGLPIW